MRLSRRVFLILPPLLLTAAAPAQPGTVRVRLVTSAGAITLALDARRAPLTVANFMRYVDDGRFDGTDFYRAARRKGEPKTGLVQGGIGTDARRILPSVMLERTDRTGIRHLDGTISMAHGADPNSAAGNFSIMVGSNPGLDASPTSPGFAAFGRVIGGMDVVRRMLAMPTGGGRGVMRGQMFLRPVRIVRAERLDGVARPTGRPKPWLIVLPWLKR
ncbi:peptidylprolyl isomerase [Sphingomonas turrisvirgatae]|uniref:peptidylprolyl isomerase n=1 Tax=Sphingomonas turrisvirgatae TaxID=1888892 RepID=A0A1E3LSK3_9SPHN|nr:peptidylprolyl isomerase [Sphingomonas turrisvirgatae]ODP36165.1 peptidylprolyl isomerase [Sphingomonas turrisvirgatae]